MGAYLVLVVVLAVPLWAYGALVGGELMPGLPVAATAFVVPVVAAALLVYREGGGAALAAFLRRAVDLRRVRDPVWWVPTLLLMPALWALSWFVMAALGRSLPDPTVPLRLLPGLAAAFLVAGAAEELGWMGYAYAPLEARWGALGASLALGAFWAAWHVVPHLTGGRDAAWIAWWALGTVGVRVLQVWVYEGTGRSLFAVVAMHASFNVAWQLFPVRGSAYDPAVLSPLIAVAALLAAFGLRRVRSRRA